MKWVVMDMKKCVQGIGFFEYKKNVCEGTETMFQLVIQIDETRGFHFDGVFFKFIDDILNMILRQ